MTTTSTQRRRRWPRLALSAVLVAGGTLHFVVPGGYEPLIPPVLGAPRPWIYGSGAAEVGAGLLLGFPRTRRLGAWASAAVLLGVWPGNIQMALEGGYPGAGGLAGNPVAAWLRVPLQVPLLLWALRYRHPSRVERLR